MHGETIFYHHNGNIKIRYKSEHGSIKGKYERFDESGNLLEITYY